MVLAHHKINFHITWPYSLIHNFRPLFNRNSIGNHTAAIFSITSLSSSTVFEVQIYSFLRFICQFIAMLRLPYPLIKPFNAHRTLTSLITSKTNQLRAPLVNRQPVNSLLLHRFIKLNKLGLELVAKILSTLRIRGQIRLCHPSALSGIPFEFSTNRRWINSQILSNIFLFHSSLNKGFNLIPLYQTELSVIF